MLVLAEREFTPDHRSVFSVRPICLAKKRLTKTDCLKSWNKEEGLVRQVNDFIVDRMFLSV